MPLLIMLVILSIKKVLAIPNFLIRQTSIFPLQFPFLNLPCVGNQQQTIVQSVSHIAGDDVAVSNAASQKMSSGECSNEYHRTQLHRR